ncbi:DUF1146 family protein [Paenibacillus tuaregi]|uniref:DUF1146 family protein n=1 Tax=Paenibacillus tuaregi TaxID=1816681 RepID=UPI0009EE44E9|nr:DUF1146 family protein [Paenibacillus tuaregi]
MDSSTVSQLPSTIAVSGLAAIIVSLVCIAVAWWALQNLKLDLIVRNPKGPQGKLLQLLLAVVLGHFVSSFILDYWGYTRMLKYMF